MDSHQSRGNASAYFQIHHNNKRSKSWQEKEKQFVHAPLPNPRLTTLKQWRRGWSHG